MSVKQTTVITFTGLTFLGPKILRNQRKPYEKRPVVHLARWHIQVCSHAPIVVSRDTEEIPGYSGTRN